MSSPKPRHGNKPPGSRPPPGFAPPTEPCVVCYREPTAWSLGPCAHPVCHECGARMRVLLGTKECPICRAEIGEALFTRSSPPLYALSAHQINVPRFGIRIEGEELKLEFDRLLECRCSVCGQVESGWEALARHAARAHSLYPCQLCTENVKLFPSEHPLRTRPDLATHARATHPPCSFCSGRRFFDKDELFRHLRREHYYCHFCDADGYNFYYSGYGELRAHFRLEHWLCEEEGCREEMFTAVWREEVDWRAHLATAHSRLLGKHATRAARALDLNFNLPARGQETRRRGGPTRQTSEEPVYVQQEVDTGDAQQFPSLGGETVATAGLRSAATWSRLSRVQEDFPSLSITTGQPAATTTASWGTRQPAAIMATGAKAPAEEFPTLSSSQAGSSRQWRPAPTKTTSKTSKTPAPDFVPLPARVKKKPVAAPPLPTPEQLHEQLVRDGAIRLEREPEPGPTQLTKKKVKKRGP